MQDKICISCNISKSILEFFKNRNECKTCRSEKSKIKYKTNKEFRDNVLQSVRNRKIFFKEKGIEINPKLDIICDFQISEFCKINYKICKGNIRINKKNNNGKYRCKYCAIFDTHEGVKSHYYKKSNTNTKNISNKNDNFFTNIDSEIKAYMLGVIAGDGSISKDKSVSVVAHYSDVETIYLFKDNISNQSKISKDGNCKKIHITSKQLASDILRHLKIKSGKKSDKIVLPDLDDNLMIHFIRGLVDTDGCIENPFTSKYSPRFFYSSTSKKILEQIKLFFKKFNINPFITGIKLTFSGRDAVAGMNLLYKDSEIFLRRKHAFYKIWSTWEPKKGTCVKPSKFVLKSKIKEEKCQINKD